jgi:hypothetical protein
MPYPSHLYLLALTIFGAGFSHETPTIKYSRTISLAKDKSMCVSSVASVCRFDVSDDFMTVTGKLSETLVHDTTLIRFSAHSFATKASFTSEISSFSFPHAQLDFFALFSVKSP